MADFRINLSDGVTTISFYEGNTVLQVDGLSMPTPQLIANRVGNPFFNGYRIGSSRYGNRPITLAIKIEGASLTEVKTSLRAIQRLLNDARQRMLNGYGDQVYLEIQWGDTAGQSTYFDVLQGSFNLPANWANGAMLRGFTLLNCVLSLECKPLGRYTNQTVAQAVLENEQDAPLLNYMDIAMAEAQGDIPAKAYIKIDLTNAAGSKKVWIWKRSGDRQTDALFFQGEAETSTTDIIAGNQVVTFTGEADVALSDDFYERSRLQLTEALAADSEISRLNYSIATPPRGLFRVLIYCQTTVINQATKFADMKWGLGWSYGARTYTPTEVESEYYSNAADATWEVIDLGLLSIPPIGESDIAGNSAFELRLYQFLTEAGSWEETKPTAHNDPGAKWNNEANAYDDNTGTLADSDAIATLAWGDWLELTRAAVVDSGGVRLYISMGTPNAANRITVELFYDAAWNAHTTNQPFTDDDWNYFYLGAVGLKDVSGVRIKFYNGDGANNSGQVHDSDFLSADYRWDVDYIQLVAIDEGVVIIDDIAAADILAIDGITDPPGVYKIVANNITDAPDYVGAPFSLGRENTRIYMLRDDGKTVTFTVDITYQPQFLEI